MRSVFSCRPELSQSINQSIDRSIRSFKSSDATRLWLTQQSKDRQFIMVSLNLYFLLQQLAFFTSSWNKACSKYHMRDESVLFGCLAGILPETVSCCKPISDLKHCFRAGGVTACAPVCTCVIQPVMLV